MLKIACFTPLSNKYPEIKKYSLNLILYLKKYMEIDVFIENSHDNLQKKREFNIYLSEEFEAQNENAVYDIILYEMADNEEHRYIYPFIFEYPGIIVLHDYAYHRFFINTKDNLQNQSFYLNELDYNYGNEGKSFANRYLSNTWTEMDDFLYPNNARMIESSVGIIAHTKEIKNHIEKKHPKACIRNINYGLEFENRKENKVTLKTKIGFQYYNFVFGIFENNGTIEKLDLTLKSFDKIVQTFTDSILLIVGDKKEKWISKIIEEFNMQESIKVIDSREPRLDDYISTIDIGFEFTNPISNKLPINMLKMMGQSIPVVIFDYPAYREIPSDCCVKIFTLAGENVFDNIYNSVYPIVTNHCLRKKIGENAKKYISDHHNFVQVAAEYYEFIVETIYRMKIKNKSYEFDCMIDTIKKEMEKIGIKNDKKLLSSMIQTRNELYAE